MRRSEEFLTLPPLSLYVHIPWCVRKCPYCDFNSHATPKTLPVDAYCDALIQDLKQDAHFAQGRTLTSIFFGGGTPSLFPPSAIGKILEAVDEIVGIAPAAEITLEANPGTAEYTNFSELKAAGVNRLSLGVQSFNPEQLRRLGRIHDDNEARKAINAAQEGGFDNLNIDLMHGLPEQTVSEAIHDLQQAVEFAPTHISWYQLTIEQNTEFYSRPPPLPQDDILADIFLEGQEFLAQRHFKQYEVSAYALTGQASQHNLNYWTFGDYLAIGAGAHGKISRSKQADIVRFQKTRLPEHYLDPERRFTAQENVCEADNLALEFMMNALRLNEGVDIALFSERTGLPLAKIETKIQSLQAKGMLEEGTERLRPSALGRLYLNNVLETFIEN